MSLSPSVDRGVTLRIGIFTTIALVLFAGALWVLGGKGGYFQTNYRLVAEFEAVQGLKVGQPVWLNGLDVGLVESISLQEDRPGRIQVVLMINQAFQPYIRSDSKAYLESKGLLGDKIVNISLGSEGHEVLLDGAQIESVPPSDFTDIMNEAGRIIATIKTSLEQIEGMIVAIAAGQGTLGKLVRDSILHDEAVGTLRRANTLLDNINDAKGTVGKLIARPDLYNRIDAIVADVEAVVAKVERGEGNLGRLLQEEGIYAQLESASTSLATVLASIERAEGTTGKALMADDLHDHIVGLIESLDLLAKDLKENPGRYFNVSVFGGRRK